MQRNQYTYTTQKALRAAFWQQHPHLSRKKIGEVSQALARRATLS